MPKLPVSGIDVTISEVSLDGRSEIEHTQNVETWGDSPGEPRITWELTDLSQYVDTLTTGCINLSRYSDFRSTFSNEWENQINPEDPDAAFKLLETEVDRFKFLKERYGETIRQLNTVIESRLAEHGYSFKNKIPPGGGFATEARRECIKVISYIWNPYSGLFNAPAQQLLWWVDEIIKDIDNGKFKERYMVGPQIAPTTLSTESLAEAPRRNLVIFKGASD